MTQSANSPLSQEEFELIEQFLSGSLAEEAQEKIRNRIDSDSGFAAKVSEIQDMQLGIERAALHSKLESFHSELAKKEPLVPIRSIHASWFWGVAASLFLVVSAGAWWIMGQKSPGEELYQAYFRPDPGLVTSMSGQGNYEFERAMVDYKEGKYEEAITRWKSLLAEKPTNDSLNYFLGSAFLAKNQEATSLDYLSIVASNPASGFYDDANWYAGLAAVKLGHTEKALAFLKVSSRPEAKNLIENLEEK